MTRTLQLLVLAMAAPVAGVWAQGRPVEIASKGAPRFLLAASPKPIPLDIRRTPMLRRQLRLDLEGVTVPEALATIANQAGLQLTYTDDIVPRGAPINLQAKAITVAAALTEVLLDAGLDVVFSASNRAVLVKRPPGAALAPTGAIVGRVTDAKTGMGVADAELYVESTKRHASSDTAGRYRITQVDTGTYTLTVRRLGYARQSRQVTVREEREDTVDVALEPVAARLQELITTATGQQRRLEVPNDITLLDADSIVRTQAIPNVTTLLETRVPGLDIQRTSGAPGDPARLRLRGASSPLRNNDPIVVVDGIRVYAEQSAARSANLANNAYAAPSPLDQIDPNTIESIEVVKGPSATTLYGQDAANGVIVITTKKGHAGPARWTASAEHGSTAMAGSYADLLVRWGHRTIDGTPVFCPIGNTIDAGFGQPVGFGLPCVGDSVRSFQILNDPALRPLDNGYRNGGNLGVSGGNSTLTYSLTGSYGREVGLIRLPDYEADRYQARTGTAPPNWMRRPQSLDAWGVTSNVTVHLRGDASVTLLSSISRQKQQRSQLEQQLGTLEGTYLDRASGTYYRHGDQGQLLAVNEDILTNYFERARANTNTFRNALNLDWHPGHWLSVTGTAGLDVGERADQTYLPYGAAPTSDSLGRLNEGRGTTIMSTINAEATASKPLGSFSGRFAVGVNYTSTSNRDVTIVTKHLIPGGEQFGSDLSAPPTELDDSRATFGWFVEPSIGNNKFQFTTGLRLDGGSGYGSGASGLQLPKFPKLGFSYVLSDERFFPLKSVFSTFRVRAAYGRAARQPNVADRLRVYNTKYGITTASDAVPALVWADGALVSAADLRALGNTQLRPERSAEFEGGIDADLLDSRVSMTVSVYRKTTDDALIGVPVAPSVYSTVDGGQATVMRNIGRTRNTGLELTLRTQLVQNGRVDWGTELQLSRRRDIVVKLAPGVEPFYTEIANVTGGGFGPSTGGLRVAPGYPLFGRWSRPIIGYADANGDHVLQRDEILLGDTAVYVGNPIPDYELTLRTNVGLFHGAVTVSGGLAYANGLSQRRDRQLELAPFSAGWNDANASIAEQLSSAVVFQNGVTDYNWIQTVNQLRFNDLAVGYRVPLGVARRLGAQTLQVLVQGHNLGLWSNYRGLDPNVNAAATGNSVHDNGVLPEPRTWQLRVNATF